MLNEQVVNEASCVNISVMPYTCDPKRPQRVRDLFINQRLTYRQIGRLEGISAPAICKILRRLGVSAREGTWVQLTCPVCGSAFERGRAAVRATKTPTCSPACYYARRKNPATVLWRHGQRLARARVRRAGFSLTVAQVVHHVNGDDRDNRLANLWVFASQSDHMKHHHGRQVVPVWRGDLRLQIVA